MPHKQTDNSKLTHPMQAIEALTHPAGWLRGYLAHKKLSAPLTTVGS